MASNGMHIHLLVFAQVLGAKKPIPCSQYWRDASMSHLAEDGRFSIPQVSFYYKLARLETGKTK
jgi:hypothetical protein